MLQIVDSATLGMPFWIAFVSIILGTVFSVIGYNYDNITRQTEDTATISDLSDVSDLDEVAVPASQPAHSDQHTEQSKSDLLVYLGYFLLIVGWLIGILVYGVEV